ncbi:alpha/beta fold hydrolase, partial [Xanthomonas oryzae]
MTRLLLLVCACLWLAGCSSPSTSLSERLVAPGGTSPLLDEERIAATIATVPNRSGHVLTRDGVPIFWRAIDPGQYAMQYRYMGQRNDPAHALDVDFSFKVPTAVPPTPRGTVVVLHGWMMDGDSLLPWSLQLAQAGYRVVTIDLRNHGHSGGGPSGYGTRESDDVIDVIDALQPRGEIRGPLYLFGISYGAATALFTADKLGPRVTGVVAMESFANAGRGIRDMVPHMLSSQPHGWRGRAVAAYARWRYADQN